MSNHNSFLPDDYLARKVAQRTNVICICLFAVVLCAVVAAFFVTDHQRAEMGDQLTRVNQQVEQKRHQLEQLESLNKRKDEMMRKANVTAALRDRVPKSSIFAELINHMPAALSLTDMELDTKVLDRRRSPRTAMQAADARTDAAGQPAIEIIPTVVELALQGMAPTDVQISDYIGALNVHPMFDEVTLEFVEETRVEDVKLRRFRIAMTLASDFSLAQLDPTRADRALKLDPMGTTLQINAEGQMVRPTESLGAVEPH